MEKLLLECVRKESDDGFKALLRHTPEKGKNIDWFKLMRFGNKLVPYVYTTLTTYPEYFSIPKRISSILASTYLSTVQNNNKISQETGVLAQAFNNAGIDYVFLKGVALLWTVYLNDQGLRPMNDIDILVRKKDIPICEDIITNNRGFKKMDGTKSGKADHSAINNTSPKHPFHREYVKEQIEVELHWDIGDPEHYTSIVEKLMTNFSDIVINGISVRVQNPEYTLFQTCVNFLNDFDFLYPPFSKGAGNRKDRIFYYRITFLYEIKNVLNYYAETISWENFIATVKSVKKEFEIFSLLLLAKYSANAGIPAAPLKQSCHGFFIRLYAFLSKRLFYKNPHVLFELRWIFIFIRAPVSPTLSVCKSLYKDILDYLEGHNRTALFILKKSVGTVKIIRRAAGYIRNVCRRS